MPPRVLPHGWSFFRCGREEVLAVAAVQQEDEPLRSLRGLLGSWAAKDFDGNVLMDGLEAMRGQYGALFRDSPQLKADIPRRIVTGDYVIDEEYGSGIVMAGFPPEGHVAVVYRVRDGLIHEVTLVM